MSKVILVTGGRTYADTRRVREMLDYHVGEDDVIVEGGAKGADKLARDWCIARGVHCATVPALWDHYSRSAGYKRNAAMLALRPDLVIAFPGGPGTANMVHQARRAGIEVLLVDERT